MDHIIDAAKRLMEIDPFKDGLFAYVIAHDRLEFAIKAYEKEQTMEILKYFEYAHLPPKLQAISLPFYNLAHDLADRMLPPSAETTTALRKLLESKDCAVRAAL